MNLPRIPPPLAQRIDRLARRAHAFHRFAHHPLCQPYRGEVLRVGRRTRVCKGCAFVAGGLLAGMVAGWLVRPAWGLACLTWPLAVGLGVLSLRRRLPKIVGRFTPAFALAFSASAGVVAFLVSSTLFAVAATLYRRRGIERSRCGTCHERSLSPCSGFVPHVRRERAFRRRVARWLDTFPPQPKC